MDSASFPPTSTQKAQSTMPKLANPGALQQCLPVDAWWAAPVPKRLQMNAPRFRPLIEVRRTARPASESSTEKGTFGSLNASFQSAFFWLRLVCLIYRNIGGWLNGTLWVQAKNKKKPSGGPCFYWFEWHYHHDTNHEIRNVLLNRAGRLAALSASNNPLLKFYYDRLLTFSINLLKGQRSSGKRR